MAKITFVCDDIKDAVLFMKIGQNEIYFDANTTQNQITIPSGTYDMILIHSRDKNSSKYSALGHKINFRFLLPYKDKKYFNHLFGWENKIKQCIVLLKIKIKNDTLINITLEENFDFNFFETKDYFYSVKITQNNQLKILDKPKQYLFYNESQKNKYYFIQLLLVFLYYFIGVFLASATLFELFVDVGTYQREASITTMIFLIVLFFIRFTIYLCRIIKKFCFDDSTLKTDKYF